MDIVFERVSWQLVHGLIEPATLADLRSTLASSSSWGSPKERYDRLAVALKRALTRDDDVRAVGSDDSGQGTPRQAGSGDDKTPAARMTAAGTTPTKSTPVSALLAGASAASSSSSGNASGSGSAASSTLSSSAAASLDCSPRLGRAPDGDALVSTLIDHIEALYRPFILPAAPASPAQPANSASTTATPTSAATTPASAATTATGSGSAASAAAVASVIPANGVSLCLSPDFTAQKKASLAVEAGYVLNVIGWLIRFTRLTSGLQRLFQLYGASLQGGLGFGSDVLSVLRTATNTNSAPDAYFRFDDTPLFPVINKSIAGTAVGASGSSSGSSSGGSATSTIPRGYSWSCWLKLNRVRDNATNLFSFLAENGCGVQTFIQQHKLRIRCLPNASETAPCNRATFPLNRWFFLVVAHIPSADKRPAQLNVFVDGTHCDQIDMEYPICPPSSSLQCTVGGFSGCMATFNFFAEPLSPKIVWSLYSLGASAVPSVHQLQTGAVAVFPPPLSSAAVLASIHSANAGGSSASSSSASSSSSPSAGNNASASAAAAAAASNRIICQLLLSQSAHECNTQTSSPVLVPPPSIATATAGSADSKSDSATTPSLLAGSLALASFSSAAGAPPSGGGAVALPVGWEDSAAVAGASGSSAASSSSSSSGGANAPGGTAQLLMQQQLAALYACARHTLRAEGVESYVLPNVRSAFASIGGFKLLYTHFSPGYAINNPYARLSGDSTLAGSLLACINPPPPIDTRETVREKEKEKKNAVIAAVTAAAAALTPTNSPATFDPSTPSSSAASPASASASAPDLLAVAPATPSNADASAAASPASAGAAPAAAQPSTPAATPAAPAIGFSSSEEVRDLFEVIACLLLESPTNQRQFLEMGVHAIRTLILDYVPPALRTVTVLHGLKQLLLVIRHIDTSNDKHFYFELVQSTLIDNIPFWIHSTAAATAAAAIAAAADDLSPVPEPDWVQYVRERVWQLQQLPTAPLPLPAPTPLPPLDVLRQADEACDQVITAHSPMGSTRKARTTSHPATATPAVGAATGSVQNQPPPVPPIAASAGSSGADRPVTSGSTISVRVGVVRLLAALVSADPALFAYNIGLRRFYRIQRLLTARHMTQASLPVGAGGALPIPTATAPASTLDSKSDSKAASASALDSLRADSIFFMAPKAANVPATIPAAAYALLEAEADSQVEEVFITDRLLSAVLSMARIALSEKNWQWNGLPDMLSLVHLIQDVAAHPSRRNARNGVSASAILANRTGAGVPTSIPLSAVASAINIGRSTLASISGDMILVLLLQSYLSLGNLAPNRAFGFLHASLHASFPALNIVAPGATVISLPQLNANKLKKRPKLKDEKKRDGSVINPRSKYANHYQSLVCVLSVDCEEARVLTLRIIANFFRVLHKNQQHTKRKDYSRFLADVCSAMSVKLLNYPLTAPVLECLMELLLGRATSTFTTNLGPPPPKSAGGAAPIASASGGVASASSGAASGTASGASILGANVDLKIDDTMRIAHPSFLSLVLDVAAPASAAATVRKPGAGGVAAAVPLPNAVLTPVAAATASALAFGERDPSFVQRVLMDLLSLLRTSAQNVAIFASFFWQHSIVRFLSPTDGVANDLVAQIITHTLLHCLANEAKGWVSVDETLWCLDRCPLAIAGGSTAASASALWRIKVFLFARIVKASTRILRRAARPAAAKPKTTAPAAGGAAASASATGSSSQLDSAFSFLHGVPTPTQIANLKKNLLATLELAESLLFASPQSFLNQTANATTAAAPASTADPAATPAADASAATAAATTAPATTTGEAAATSAAAPADVIVTADDLELLARLLSTSMRMLELPERRQDVLRLIFRYAQFVLPHPGCSALTPRILSECRKLLIEKLASADSEKNHRAVTLCLLLLKQAMESFMRHQQIQNVVLTRRLMIDLFHFWGPLIFAGALSPAVAAALLVPIAPPNPTPPPPGSAAAANAGPPPHVAAAAVLAQSATGSALAALLITHNRERNARRAAVTAATAKLAFASEADDSDDDRGSMPFGWHLSLTGVAAGTADTARSKSSDTESLDASSAKLLEEILFVLYQIDVRAHIDQTQSILTQHQQRFNMLLQVRGSKLNNIVLDYQNRKVSTEDFRHLQFMALLNRLTARSVRRQLRITKLYINFLNRVALASGGATVASTTATAGVPPAAIAAVAAVAPTTGATNALVPTAISAAHFVSSAVNAAVSTPTAAAAAAAAATASSVAPNPVSAGGAAPPSPSFAAAPVSANASGVPAAIPIVAAASTPSSAGTTAVATVASNANHALVVAAAAAVAASLVSSVSSSVAAPALSELEHRWLRYTIDTPTANPQNRSLKHELKSFLYELFGPHSAHTHTAMKSSVQRSTGGGTTGSSLDVPADDDRVYWKLDKTESPSRQRKLMRADPFGTSHPEATNIPPALLAVYKQQLERQHKEQAAAQAAAAAAAATAAAPATAASEVKGEKKRADMGLDLTSVAAPYKAQTAASTADDAKDGGTPASANSNANTNDDFDLLSGGGGGDGDGSEDFGYAWENSNPNPVAAPSSGSGKDSKSNKTATTPASAAAGAKPTTAVTAVSSPPPPANRAVGGTAAATKAGTSHFDDDSVVMAPGGAEVGHAASAAASSFGDGDDDDVYRPQHGTVTDDMEEASKASSAVDDDVPASGSRSARGDEKTGTPVSRTPSTATTATSGSSPNSAATGTPPVGAAVPRPTQAAPSTVQLPTSINTNAGAGAPTGNPVISVGTPRAVVGTATNSESDIASVDLNEPDEDASDEDEMIEADSESASALSLTASSASSGTDSKSSSSSAAASSGSNTSTAADRLELEFAEHERLVRRWDHVVLINPVKKFYGFFLLTTQRIVFAGRELMDSGEYDRIVKQITTPPPKSSATAAAAAAAAASGTGTSPAASLAATQQAQLAAFLSAMPKLRRKYLEWGLPQIRLVLPRCYLLRESAIEIFLKNYKNYFFNFSASPLHLTDDPSQGPLPAFAAPSASPHSRSKSIANAPAPAAAGNSKSAVTERNAMYKALCTQLQLPYELSAARRLAYSDLTKKWCKWQLSSFEYLMHLNTIAGRTYNDINQYPVFPWVLRDYHSKELDLTNPAHFRDLSKPIGALNPDRWKIYEERFSTFEDPRIPPFHYGSHYSSAGIALHYLLRVEPFTSLNIHLQSGRFDLADRLFDSLATSWDLSYTNVADVKELIPEFFYMPDFLLNGNRLDLGIKQDRSRLTDVGLPAWASSAEDFIRQHRDALESEHVSEHLHEWIDLIFGYKQKGKPAEDAKNVFFYLTYAGNADLESIVDPGLRRATEDQIAHFGQTPTQLLTTPHPKRAPKSECLPADGCITLPVRLPPVYRPIPIYHYFVAGPPAPTAHRPSASATLSGPLTGSSTRKLGGISSQTALLSETDRLPAVPHVVVFASNSLLLTLDTSHGLMMQGHALHNFVTALTTNLPPPQTPNLAAISAPAASAQLAALAALTGTAMPNTVAALSAATAPTPVAVSGSAPPPSATATSAGVPTVNTTGAGANAAPIVPTTPQAKRAASAIAPTTPVPMTALNSANPIGSGVSSSGGASATTGSSPATQPANTNTSGLSVVLPMQSPMPSTPLLVNDSPIHLPLSSFLDTQTPIVDGTPVQAPTSNTGAAPPQPFGTSVTPAPPTPSSAAPTTAAAGGDSFTFTVSGATPAAAAATPSAAATATGGVTATGVRSARSRSAAAEEDSDDESEIDPAIPHYNTSHVLAHQHAVAAAAAGGAGGSSLRAPAPTPHAHAHHHPYHRRHYDLTHVQEPIPDSVISSTSIPIVCRHWLLHTPHPLALSSLFLHAPSPAAAAMAQAVAAAGAGSSATAVVPAPTPVVPVLPNVTNSMAFDTLAHPVAVVTKNAKFIFSAGYLDRSLKCHLVNTPREVLLAAEKSAEAPAGSSAGGSGTTPSSGAQLLSGSSAASASGSSSTPNHSLLMSCTPLSSVVVHGDVISAIALASDQTYLVTGSRDGAVMLWRVLTSRHEWTRPPLSSSPYASFTAGVRIGPVLGVAINPYAGLAVSLHASSSDPLQRGRTICVYSTRRARFIRCLSFASGQKSLSTPAAASASAGSSVVASASGVSAAATAALNQLSQSVDLQLIALTNTGNIVVSGIDLCDTATDAFASNGASPATTGVPRLWLYSPNGTLLASVCTYDVITCLSTTPHKLSRTTDQTPEGFVVTGGERGEIVFRHSYNLEHVQTLYCTRPGSGHSPSLLHKHAQSHAQQQTSTTAAAVRLPVAAAVNATPTSTVVSIPVAAPVSVAAPSSSGALAPVAEDAPAPVATPAADATVAATAPAAAPATASAPGDANSGATPPTADSAAPAASATSASAAAASGDAASTDAAASSAMDEKSAAPLPMIIRVDTSTYGWRVRRPVAGVTALDFSPNEQLLAASFKATPAPAIAPHAVGVAPAWISGGAQPAAAGAAGAAGGSSVSGFGSPPAAGGSLSRPSSKPTQLHAGGMIPNPSESDPSESDPDAAAYPPLTLASIRDDTPSASASVAIPVAPASARSGTIKAKPKHSSHRAAAISTARPLTTMGGGGSGDDFPPDTPLSEASYDSGSGFDRKSSGPASSTTGTVVLVFCTIILVVSILGLTVMSMPHAIETHAATRAERMLRLSAAAADNSTTHATTAASSLELQPQHTAVLEAEVDDSGGPAPAPPPLPPPPPPVPIGQAA